MFENTETIKRSEMMIRNMNWDELIKANPKRYLTVYDKNTHELIEVHDTENGNVWSRIDENRWMFIN